MSKIKPIYIAMITPFLLVSCKETCSYSEFQEAIRNKNFPDSIKGPVYQSSVARYKGTIYYYNPDEKYEQKKEVDNLAFFKFMSTTWEVTTPSWDYYVRIEQNVMIQIKKVIENRSIKHYANASLEEIGSYTFYKNPLAYRHKITFKDTEQKEYDSSGNRHTAIINGKANLYYEFDDQYGWTTHYTEDSDLSILSDSINFGGGPVISRIKMDVSIIYSETYDYPDYKNL